MTTTVDYVRAMLGARDPLLDSVLRDAILEHGLRPMQIDDNAARVMQLLTKLAQPRRAIEIGTYFGYSTIHIARGLPVGGMLTTLEIDDQVAGIARRNLAGAGVEDRVEIVVGDAAVYLAEVEPESVGLIFIDADKRNYPEYLKLCFPLLERGGILVADDAFAHGDFAPEAIDDGMGQAEVRAINTYNRAVLRSAALLSAFIGTNNGMLVSMKL